MEIQILAHSDLPVKKRHRWQFCKFWSHVIKTGFLNPARILRFSHLFFVGLRRETSQMIENSFLYKMAYFNNFLNATFYMNGINFEKKSVQLQPSKFSVVVEYGIKVSGPRLNF